ncbi:uncharacterized protein TNCV_731541 [Trichonephila clavipes]|nr:uncharacterized protein TNCV_731541 [Trichonephila clavipes]
MAYLGKGRIAEPRYIAKQLVEKVTDDLKIIYLKNLIVNSPNYEEEFVREMLKKHNSGNINNVNSKSENVSLDSCIIKSKENEVVMPVLRETGASLDIGFEKCAAPEMFKGEQGLDQTIELLEPDLEQNGLPRPEIGNEMQTRRERRKEAEKSIRLENEKDQFRLRGSVVEIGEDFVPSLTGEGTDNGNLVKLSACEIMEAQLRSEESAPLIRGTENEWRE